MPVCLRRQIMNRHVTADLCFFPPFRSWQPLSWHTPWSGPLACSSIQLSLAVLSPALIPSSLSTVPTSKLPEILPGMEKGLRCCPRRLREPPGCARGATLGPFSYFWHPRPSRDEPHSCLLGVMWGAQPSGPVEPAAGLEMWSVGAYEAYETQRDMWLTQGFKIRESGILPVENFKSPNSWSLSLSWR